MSFYGDEAIGAPPQTLYAETDARTALDDASYVLDCCQELLEELKRSKNPQG